MFPLLRVGNVFQVHFNCRVFCRKPETSFRENALVATLREAGIAEQVTDADGSDPAAGDSSVKRDDPAAAAPLCCAYDVALKSCALECLFGCSATGLMEFRRIEIGKADLDPLIGIGRLADAKTVSVANVPDGTGELEAGLVRKTRFAWICVGGSGGAEEGERAAKKGKPAAHAASFSLLLSFFFFRIARTNLSHRAMPARFSGM